MSKITVREDRLIQLEEVYRPIVLKTREGVEYIICMRDYGIEVTETSIGTVSLQPNQLPNRLNQNKDEKERSTQKARRVSPSDYGRV